MQKSAQFIVYSAQYHIFIAHPLVLETRLKMGNLQCKTYFNRNEELLLMIENFKTY